MTGDRGDFAPPQHGARFVRPSAEPWRPLWRGGVVDLADPEGGRFATLSMTHAEAVAWVRGEA